MRLLELVPCGVWRAAVSDDAPEEQTAAPVAPAACVSPEKRRRRATSGSSSPWRPSLGSISEDNVVVKMAAVTAARKGGEKTARSKPSPMKPRARVAGRRERARDDYRHYGVPPIVPAFTPTAFLF